MQTLCRIRTLNKNIERTARQVDMKWEFVTRPMRGISYVAWNWQWRAIDERGDTKVSTRTFATFRECVARCQDPRLHGQS
jgi:hypothetical protein